MDSLYENINTVFIEDKGNTRTRLIIDRDNNVRIKLGIDVPSEDKIDIVHKLATVADKCIEEGLNTQTLRVALKYKPDTAVVLFKRYKEKNERRHYTVYM